MRPVAVVAQPCPDIENAQGAHTSSVVAIRVAVDLTPCPDLKRLRAPSLTAADIEKAAQLYRAGQTLAVVGQHFLVHLGTILHHLRRAGVPMRDCQGRVRS